MTDFLQASQQAVRPSRIMTILKVAAFSLANAVLAIAFTTGLGFVLRMALGGVGTLLFGGFILLAFLGIELAVATLLGKKWFFRTVPGFAIFGGCLVALAAVFFTPTLTQYFSAWNQLGKIHIDASGHEPVLRARIIQDAPWVHGSMIRWTHYINPIAGTKERTLVFNAATGAAEIHDTTKEEADFWPQPNYSPCAAQGTGEMERFFLDVEGREGANCEVTASTDRYVAYRTFTPVLDIEDAELRKNIMGQKGDYDFYFWRLERYVVAERASGRILLDRRALSGFSSSSFGNVYYEPSTSEDRPPSDYYPVDTAYGGMNPYIIGDDYYYLSGPKDVSKINLVDGSEKVIAHVAEPINKWGVGDGFVAYTSHYDMDVDSLYVQAFE